MSLRLTKMDVKILLLVFFITGQCVWANTKAKAPLGRCKITCDSGKPTPEKGRNLIADLKQMLFLRDCSQVIGEPKKVMNLYPFDDSLKFVRARCSGTSQGEKWTVIQQRNQSSAVDFQKTWKDYENGFGKVDDGEYWLGLDAMHHLTKAGDQILQIEVEDKHGNIGHATYNTFIVNSKTTNYTLNIGNHDQAKSDIDDALAFNHGMKFTTIEEDHDWNRNGNCAKEMSGGWWYRNCAYANLNGNHNQHNFRGIIWRHWNNLNGLKSTKMMIKPKQPTSDNLN